MKPCAPLFKQSRGAITARGWCKQPAYSFFNSHRLLCVNPYIMMRVPMLTRETHPPAPPWERSKTFSRLLTPFGWAYGMGMEIRNRLYDRGILKSHRIPIPVISVGNLTVGGTGKTPIVIEIARGLLKRNSALNIGILSRGYGRSKKRDWIVSDGITILAGPDGSGDEPQVIARELPGVRVFVGADRVEIANKAINRFPLDLLLLDDAFQHRRIGRDVDILLVDGQTGLGNGRVLPAGPLREFPRNIKRATCLLVNHDAGQLPAVLEKFLPPGKPIFRSRMVPDSLWDGILKKKLPLDALNRQEIWGICGIARPDSFLDTLGSLGARIAGFTPFPDHHAYSREELQAIARQAGEDRLIVTTWKDWVKLEKRHPFRKVCVLGIRNEFLEEEKFYTFLEKFVYNRKNQEREVKLDA